MRYQGRITDWKDDRGFGFISPNGGGVAVFVHISAMAKGQRRPIGNELVTYEVLKDEKKGLRAQNVVYVGVTQALARENRREHGHAASRPDRRADLRANRRGSRLTTIAALVLVGLGGYAWQEFSAKRAGLVPERTPTVEVPGRTPTVEVSGRMPIVEPKSTAKFQCEGKQHCSQMSSCEEATFYLRNCPGVKIDGDGDGIPCEDQICGH